MTLCSFLKKNCRVNRPSLTFLNIHKEIKHALKCLVLNITLLYSSFLLQVFFFSEESLF